MRRLAVVLVSHLCLVPLWGGIADDNLIAARGDANNDAVVDVSDAVFLLHYIAFGGKAPPCLNQADANADGSVNAADVSYLLNFLYNGGAPPPFPGPFNRACVQMGAHPNLGCDACRR